MLHHLVYRIPVSTGKLIGMSLPPPAFQWEHLRAAGITHVVSLCEVEKDRIVVPVRLLYSCELEDISGDEVPSDPEENGLHLWRAAYHVWAALRVGRGVAVHCDGGRQRTGTVLAATLRLRGLPFERAIEVVVESIRSVGAGPWSGAAWHMKQIQNPPQSLLKLPWRPNETSEHCHRRLGCGTFVGSPARKPVNLRSRTVPQKQSHP